MLYAVYGTEIDKARAKKDALVASCRKQRPDAEFFVIDNENFSESALESLYSSQGLFVKKHIVVLDRVFPRKKVKEGEEETKKENKDAVKESILSAFPMIASSESVFILFDEGFDAKTLVLVKKYAKDSYVFGEKKEKKGYSENITFSISDSFASKDKRGAWIQYQKAIRQGIAPEAIYGALFSSIKMMLLAKKTKSAEDAGANPFPYKKAKSFAGNYTENDLNEMLTKLNKLYHSIRMDGGELEILLEKFLLEK
ncbi:MAG: hypothetical protein WCT49_05255 [Candidatus Paceibacterota bacterium]|nr:hypothetical protein [Candidatus Paceibacterota bacterium]